MDMFAQLKGQTLEPLEFLKGGIWTHATSDYLSGNPDEVDAEWKIREDRRKWDSL